MPKRKPDPKINIKEERGVPIGRLPRVFIRGGYAMIDTGNGTARQVDPQTDGEILEQLEVRLDPETMSKLRSAIFEMDFTPDGKVKELPEGTELIAKTPRELLMTRLFVKNFARNGERAQAYIRSLPGNWKVRKVGSGQWDFAVSQDGVKWHIFDPGPLQQFKESGRVAKETGNILAGVQAGRTENAVDLLDITTDVINGAGSAAGFAIGAGGGAPTGPGALVTGSLAAGVTAAGLEGVKQIIGQAAGISGNISMSDAAALGAITTVFSAAAPGIARGVRFTGRQVAKLFPQKVRDSLREALLEAGAGMSGIGGSGSLKPERVLERRIRDPAKILEEIPGIDDTAAAMRNLIKTVSRDTIPEQPLAAQMEAAASDAGATINVAGLIDDMLTPLTPTKGTGAGELQRAARTIETIKKTPGRRFRVSKTTETKAGRERVLSLEEETLTGKGGSQRVQDVTESVSRGGATVPVRTKEAALKRLGTEENVSQKVQNLIDDIHAVIALDGGDSRAVSVATAVQIKKAIQSVAAERGAFAQAANISGRKGAEGITQFDNILKEFQSVLRQRISGEVEALGVQASDGSGRIYSQVMKDFARKADQLERWKLNLGAKLSDEEGRKVAADFLRRLHQTSMGGFRDSANSLQASTGIDIISAAERAMISELFGEAGAAKIFPRISAIGEPVGSGLGRKALLLGGAGALFGGGTAVTGNPLFGLAAMGLGGTAASEAGQLAIARNAPRIAGAVSAMGSRTLQALDNSVNTTTLTTIQSIARHIQNQSQTAMTPEQIAEFNALPEAERRKRMGAQAQP